MMSQGINVASDGSVYVADGLNHRIQKFSSNGIFIKKWGTFGTGDGQFRYPHGIAEGSDGKIYVADNHRLQRFTPEGMFVSKLGTEGSADGQFRYPKGVASESNGSIYVVDGGQHRIQKFSTGP